MSTMRKKVSFASWFFDVFSYFHNFCSNRSEGFGSRNTPGMDQSAALFVYMGFVWIFRRFEWYRYVGFVFGDLGTIRKIFGVGKCKVFPISSINFFQLISDMRHYNYEFLLDFFFSIQTYLLKKSNFLKAAKHNFFLVRGNFCNYFRRFIIKTKF